MPRPISRRHAVAALTIPAFFAVSGCTLRLEDDVAPSGRTSSGGQSRDGQANDGETLTPIATFADALARSMPKQPAAVQAQIKRLWATHDALGQHKPKGTSATWPQDAGQWVTSRDYPARLAELSPSNAPLAHLCAATLLAYAQRDRGSIRWPAAMQLPHAESDHIAVAADAAVQALEWRAGRARAGADEAKAKPFLADLTPLYAIRNLAQAAQPSEAGFAGRRFSSDKEADAFVRTQLLAVQTACARASAATDSAEQSTAVLYVWSTARLWLLRHGQEPGAFDGLRES